MARECLRNQLRSHTRLEHVLAQADWDVRRSQEQIDKLTKLIDRAKKLGKKTFDADGFKVGEELIGNSW